jgi:cytochrome c oxidase cbb3-type subunit IV
VEVSGVVSGLVVAGLLASFIGLVAWAWSSRRREQFEAAARLPLEEDKEQLP